MNITIHSAMTNISQFQKYIPNVLNNNVKFFSLDEDKKMIKEASETEILINDAMGVVSDEVLNAMPNLKLILSEGVGYQGVDVKKCNARGITVCNNKGINDTAVAEDSILLMLACLRDIINGNNAVYEGRQINVKQASFGKVRELSECKVGLIGFGDIARKTAEFLNAFGAEVYYYNRTRYEDLEVKYNVKYLTLDELLSICDFVSLHIASCEDTKNMVNEEFLKKMKKSAYLINTSRGDLVDNNALLNALLNDEIAGAGLDVISPEPVEKDNALLNDKIKNKLVLTPHIAGITSLTVKKLYELLEKNINAFINNQELLNIVTK